MLCSDLRTRMGAVVALCLLLVSACGFEPVYREGGGLQERLHAVYVEPINDRVGQAARNALLDAIGAPDNPSSASYRLSMSIIDERERAGIQADETASRVNIVLITRWKLTLNDIDRTPVGAGRIQHQVPYNVVEDDYASLIAERDAEKLVGRLTGEAVRTRILLLLKDG